MTEIEAERVFTIFNELLETLGTAVYKADGEHAERLLLRKTFPTHFAACSWPLDSVEGFLPYSLALQNKAIGCRHSIAKTPTELILCIAAPTVEILREAMACVYETNSYFLKSETEEPAKLSFWVRGPNEENHEIPDYRGEALGHLDFAEEL